jgi:hypothetical protein
MPRVRWMNHGRNSQLEHLRTPSEVRVRRCSNAPPKLSPIAQLGSAMRVCYSSHVMAFGLAAAAVARRVQALASIRIRSRLRLTYRLYVMRIPRAAISLPSSNRNLRHLALSCSHSAAENWSRGKLRRAKRLRLERSFATLMTISIVISPTYTSGYSAASVISMPSGLTASRRLRA